MSEALAGIKVFPLADRSLLLNPDNGRVAYVAGNEAEQFGQIQRSGISPEGAGAALLRRLYMTGLFQVVSRDRIAPKAIIFDPVDACDLACPGCYRAGRLGGGYADERLIAEVLELAGAYPDALLIVTGGECSLHPRIESILERAGRLPNPKQVITDGARWTDRMLALCRDGHMRLTVSLDHASAALNSRSRDPRAFGQAMALVERAHAMGLPVRANAVVSAYNYKDARAILSFLSEQGITVVEFILFHAPRPVEFSLTAGMLHDFLTNLVPLQLEFAHLAIENVRMVYTRTFLSPRSDCGGGTHVIKVLPGRRVKPCSFSDVEETVPEGRSLTEYFRQPGPGFEALRRSSVLDDPECRQCDLRFLCGGGCPVRAGSATPARGCAKKLYWQVLFERPRLEPLYQML